ncbi:endonuclease domain-containing protein [Brachybacterium nesterenkovii]|uniref:endonuclease domain-containing protein n=1 Tax=Brachybacterium nesterenkovii TaxID=47847 RepID=UPI001F38624D|nr:hypothetical protein [Brachybacterium nesterenkovii]
MLLAHALRCQEPETTAILMESALHQGLILPDDLMSLIHEAPVAARRTFHSLSTASESGSETRVVRWLRHRGFQVEQQVFIEEVGYVDAYAGGVVLEMDGRTYHSSPEAFAEDRRRDLVMRRLGLQPIRLSYGQIWHDWRRTRVGTARRYHRSGGHGPQGVRASNDSLNREHRAGSVSSWPGSTLRELVAIHADGSRRTGVCTYSYQFS